MAARGEDVGAAGPTAATAAGPPDVIAFDTMETLFSLGSLQPLLVAAGGTSSTLPLWFARLLRDGFALVASGDYRSFSDVARTALRSVLPDASDGALDDALAGLAELGLAPESEAALGRAVMGARVFVITNAGTGSTEALLASSGLDAFVERVVSAGDAGAWKPAARPYIRAAELAGVAPDRVAMVTVHPWDVHGAHRAGLLTGWCNRGQGHFPSAFARPDVEADGLLALVERLLGSPV
jgi:2-haloacid dehalogenase